MTPQEVLAIPLPANQHSFPRSAKTVRDALLAIVAVVWEEGESFSGKRPFGNSGWEFDLYVPLVRASLVRGAFDEYGYLEDVDDAAADALILAAIHALGEPSP